MTEFSSRFQDFREKKELYSVFCDPMGIDIDTMPADMQLEVIDIQSSSLLAAFSTLIEGSCRVLQVT